MTISTALFQVGTRWRTGRPALGLPAIGLLAIGFLATAGPAYAQDSCAQSLAQAQNAFEAGYFDDARDLVLPCLTRRAFTPEEEERAYLLLGMVYYANLQIDEAKDTLRRLLQREPDFEPDPSVHSPGFVALVDEVRGEMDASEAPPPTPPAGNADPAPSDPEPAAVTPEPDAATPAVQPDVLAPPAFRSGFWISVGLGPGAGELDCGGCGALPDNDPWNGGGGLTLSLAMGGTIAPKWLLGGEFNFWGRTDSEGERTAVIGSLAAIVQFYPSETGDFFLRFGAGVGTYALERDVPLASEPLTIEGSGSSVQFGLGYNIRVGTSFALTPYANVVGVFVDSEEVNSVRLGERLIGPENPGYLQIGLALSWY